MATPAPLDIVYISGLKVNTTIGVFEWERAIKQPLTFDVELHHDSSQAAQSDDVNFAIDYAAVSEQIKSFTENSSFKLIEALADQLANQLLSQFNIASVKLKVSKAGAVKGTQDVGIIIQRFAQ